MSGDELTTETKRLQQSAQSVEQGMDEKKMPMSSLSLHASESKFVDSSRCGDKGKSPTSVESKTKVRGVGSTRHRVKMNATTVGIVKSLHLSRAGFAITVSKKKFAVAEMSVVIESEASVIWNLVYETRSDVMVDATISDFIGAFNRHVRKGAGVNLQFQPAFSTITGGGGGGGSSSINAQSMTPATQNGRVQVTCVLSLTALAVIAAWSKQRVYRQRKLVQRTLSALGYSLAATVVGLVCIRALRTRPLQVDVRTTYPHPLVRVA